MSKGQGWLTAACASPAFLVWNPLVERSTSTSRLYANPFFTCLTRNIINTQKEKNMTRKLYVLLSLALVAAFVLTACGGSKAPAAGQKVTITWWHITTKDPGLSDWKKTADDYMAAHPNVTVEITVLENEAFKTKLTSV